MGHSVVAKVASFYFLFEIKLLTAQVIASASSICASTPSLLIFRQKRGVVGTYHKYDEEDLYLRLAKLIHMLLLHLTSVGTTATMCYNLLVYQKCWLQ